MPGMRIKVEHVNPFVTSTMDTFAKMIGVAAKPGNLMVKQSVQGDTFPFPFPKG